MGKQRSLRQKQRAMLVVVLAATIIAVPVFSQPLSIHLAVSTATTPAAAPIATASTAAVSNAGSVFDIDIPELDESVSLANRSGDVLSQAVSDSIQNMALGVTGTVPAFVDASATAYIRSATAAVYVSPDAAALHVIALQIGDTVAVTGTSAGWLRINYQDSQMFVQLADTTFDMVFVPAEGLRYVQTTDEAELKLFAAPSRDSEVLKQIWFADRVTALETSKEWTKIHTESGFDGYVPNAILTPDIVFVQDGSTKYVTQEIAVYSFPDEASEVVHYYSEDDAVSLTGYSFDWCRIITSDDEVGYVKMENLTDSAPYSAPAYYAPAPQVWTPRYEYSDGDVQTVINTAMSYVGGAYALGGTSYGGIDCSGLTMRAYESVGIYITRSSYAYWGVGYGVSFSDLRPGDIVCYDSEWNGSIGHVAIYIGGGQVVHAMNEWRGVGVSSVYFGGYNILSVRRLIG